MIGVSDNDEFDWVGLEWGPASVARGLGLGWGKSEENFGSSGYIYLVENFKTGFSFKLCSVDQKNRWKENK